MNPKPPSPPDHRSAPASPRLADLQSLRGLAALMVVLFHTGEIFKLQMGTPWAGNLCRMGFLGVDVFFVISGFIILWIHHGDLGKPDRVRSYAIKRAYRILPLYWVVLLLKGLKEFRHLDWVTMVCAVFLIPYPLPPFINLSWTLTFEVLFYITFAGAILWGLRRGLLLVSAVMIGLALLPAPLSRDGSVLSTAVNFFFDQHVLEFLAGMGVALLLRRRAARFPTAVAVLGILALTCFLLGTTRHALRSDETVLELTVVRYSSIFFGLPTALLVFGLVGRELSGRAPVLGLLKAFGESSYSLYLLHGYILFNACRLPRFRSLALEHPAAMGIPILVSFATAALAYRFIEKPFMELGRRRAARLEPA